MLRSLCGRMKPMRGLGFKIEAARSDPQCAQSGNGGWFSDQDRGAAVLLRPHLTALVTSTFLPLSDHSSASRWQMGQFVTLSVASLSEEALVFLRSRLPRKS